MKKPTKLKAPYLRKVLLLDEDVDDWSRYPFTLPVLSGRRFEINFEKRVSVIAGANGVGKSTIIEVIADKCGFGVHGGSNSYNMAGEPNLLSRYFRLSWLPRISKGFFVKAESLFAFSQQIDQLAKETGSDIYDGYGGRSLGERSHGEAFMQLFRRISGHEGVYILDEPEAALSPKRQIDFLRTIKALDDAGTAQIIIATHSPIIMAYPGADLFVFDDGSVSKVGFKATEHFRILKSFYDDPDAFMERALSS